jgi:predicted Zn-dependent protease
MKKLFREIAISVFLFFGILFATLQVDWLKVLHLTPTIIGDKLSELVWDFISSGLYEVDSEKVCLPIDTLVHEMCIANGIDTASVSIVVARTYEVNAFATVGNHLVVNTGLISEMDNETQLSAALGHEMAHIQLGHIQKSIRQNAALQAILILVTGNSRSNNIRKITEKLISSGITRAKEREADESGARYIDAMHLDAKEMAIMFEKFKDDNSLSYFKDHDNNQKRAAHIREMHFTSKEPYRQILSPDTREAMQEVCR